MLAQCSHTMMCSHVFNPNTHEHALVLTVWVNVFSTELDQLVEKLDKFALDDAKSKKNFVPDRIQRVISSEPSSTPPPPDAPNWALKPEWKRGT